MSRTPETSRPIETSEVPVSPDPERAAETRMKQAERLPLPSRAEMVAAAFERRIPHYQEAVRNAYKNIATWSKNALESMSDLSLNAPEKSSVKSIIQKLGTLSSTMMADSLHGMQRELDTLSLGLSRFPAGSREQIFIADLRTKIQSAINANPVAETIYRGQHPEKKYDTSSAKGSLRMIGTLAAAGIALLSGLMDMRRGRLSVSTLAYGALAYMGAGGFQGSYASEVQFLTAPEYKNIANSLGLPPRELGNFVEHLWTPAGANQIRELRNIDKKFKGTAQEKQEKIQDIIGNLQKDLPKSGAKRQDILKFADIIQSVGDPDARKVVLALIDPKGHPAE